MHNIRRIVPSDPSATSNALEIWKGVIMAMGGVISGI